MDWGIAINLREAVSEIVKKAQIADQGDIDNIWITDYPATRFSPALAAIIAQNTEKSRIGVGLLSPLKYSAAHIVQMMNTLILTYGDRFDLLVGPGDRTRLQEIGVGYGNISTLVKRMEESVKDIREGLAENKECRIFVGAQGARMIQVSTNSDGILLNYSDPEMIRWAFSLLKNRETEFEMGIFPPSLIGSSKACSEHTGIKASAAVVALGLNPSIMKMFRLEEALQPARTKMREQGLTNDVIEMIDFNTLSRFSLCGSIESTMEYLMKYKDLGVKHIVFGPPQGATVEGVRQLVKARRKSYNSI